MTELKTMKVWISFIIVTQTSPSILQWGTHTQYSAHTIQTGTMAKHDPYYESEDNHTIVDTGLHCTNTFYHRLLTLLLK